jgi:maspardin
MDGLCKKGYRVVAAQHPPYYTINEFILGMDGFLDALEAPSVHILGASLGGLLAQQYSIARPKRVSSIILCNSFYSTKAFEPSAGSVVTSMYAVTPYFVLKNMLLTSFNNDAAAISASPEVADAVDFVMEQMNSLSQEDLASRLTLNCSPSECSAMKIGEDKMTIIDALDRTARPPEARDELYSKYTSAKQALCRTGGDFPFLSVADEVCLYIEVRPK